ncbi:MAG: hypothetical protein APR54_09595 [Candidatus Cloacimonas sp. SDB]|nr:MAG: hypothetical protein APR54_09595 [Candidatus Cloacimonas sp. SDB]
MVRIFFIALLLLPHLLLSQNPSPTGRWRTIDDETGKPRSVIVIWEESGVLKGKIEQLFLQEDEDPDPLCDKCKGDFKDQPIIGMTILNDLKRSANQWKGGTIMDPDNGKLYNCKIEVIDNGLRLKVRGFIGFSLLGRTQYWEKVE